MIGYAFCGSFCTHAASLRELRTRVRVNDGWMVLQQPLTVDTAVGQLKPGMLASRS